MLCPEQQSLLESVCITKHMSWTGISGATTLNQSEDATLTGVWTTREAALLANDGARKTEVGQIMYCFIGRTKNSQRFALSDSQDSKETREEKVHTP